MTSNDIVIVTPSFGGIEPRLEFMMKTVRENDPAALAEKWMVVEDPCDRLGVTEGYKDLCWEYGLEFHKLPAWSNMHGAAMQAFDRAIANYDPKWIIYLGDDLAITPKSLSSVFHFLRTNQLECIGLAGIPYWNAHELRPEDDKLAWYYSGTDWTRSVPSNSHWNGDGYCRPYVNVNGAGFAARASMYREVGGFAEGTWCLDESISYRCWTRSPYSIVTLPGPPFVHFFGGSTLSRPPQHDMHTEARWIEAIGKSKAECDKEMRAIMGEREEKVLEEMRNARYFVG